MPSAFPPNLLKDAQVTSVRIVARRRAKARLRHRASPRRLSSLSFGAFAAQVAEHIQYPPAPEPLDWDDPAVLNPLDTQDGRRTGWSAL